MNGDGAGSAGVLPGDAMKYPAASLLLVLALPIASGCSPESSVQPPDPEAAAQEEVSGEIRSLYADPEPADAAAAEGDEEHAVPSEEESIARLSAAEQAFSARLDELRGLCDKDDFRSCTQLGLLYDQGREVDQDYMRAHEYYGRSCELGHAQACNNLGWLYLHGLGVDLDYQMANRLFSKACDLNYGRACSNLGYAISQGRGAVQNHQRANQLFTKGCRLNYGGACSNLGWSYQYGYGLRQDYQKAAEYYGRGCKLKYARACANLGAAYSYGQGVRQSFTEAKRLFGQACDLGDQKGCDRYRMLNQRGY